MTIELSADDFQLLLLALGIATGDCVRQGRSEMAHSLVRLANKVNQNNPNWTPYVIPSSSSNDD